MGSASGGSLRCKQDDRAADADIGIYHVGEYSAGNASEGPVSGQYSDNQSTETI